ncbi:hypothetical protein, partial [Streptomyces capoamus]|uniref:hypothetical protein n=1 Tax=Streptomyces capoamus TaxID=68183 RepID=UPI0016733B6D
MPGIEHEAPVTSLSPAGRVVTYNAVREIDGSVLRMPAVRGDGAAAGDSCLLSWRHRCHDPRGTLVMPVRPG